jgi:molecular chaperone GrpE (heat shock protein)
MHDRIVHELAKWPFFLGDALLLGAAWFISWQSPRPLAFWTLALGAGCIAAGAALCVLPFVLQYRALVKLAEAGTLTTAVSQIQHLEAIAAQISGATGRWQNAQEEADKTAEAAKAIADRMTAEAKAFTQFMQQANDHERATLRLEVEKLHRAENEWLQALVRILDHVYALNLGAVRSGQPKLIEQVGNFQNACRDAARRVGLTPFVPQAAEPFDAQKHQLIEGNEPAPEGAILTETVAAGYTFQGRLLRPAMVRANGNGNGTEEKSTPPPTADPQSQLELEAKAG